MLKNRVSLLCVLFLAFCVNAASLGAQSLSAFVDSLVSTHWEETVQVAFGSITWEYSALATPFSRWLEDELSAELQKSSKYRVFNRSVVLAMDPAFRESFAEFFATNQVSALISGRFFEEGNRVRTRIELTDMRTGNLIGSGDWTVNKSVIPSSIAVRPGDSERERMQSLSTVFPAFARDTQRLGVSLSTDRGVGGAYRAGEYLTVFVTVTDDAWVRLYHIDSSGNTQLIWPNAYSPSDGRVRAGRVVQLPGSGDPFAFLMKAPYGTEYIKVVASTVPFTDAPTAFADMGTDSRGVISRGLTGVALGEGSDAVLAEAVASYLISER